MLEVIRAQDEISGWVSNFRELHQNYVMSQAARIQALSVGHALDVGSAGFGIVHSVFARAVNLMIRAEMWTLLTAEKADLPFGIRVAWADFDVLGLRNGDPVNVRGGFVSIGSGSTSRVVDCRAAPRWLPARHNKIEPGLAGRLAVVATAASDRSWRESARMAQAVRSALEVSAALGDVLAKVIGRGPGSTPSGDDVLVGILAVLNSPHSGAAGAREAESLGRAILPLLWTTSDVSRQLLRQAAKGLFSRDLHELVLALLGNPPPQQLQNAVRRVIETGATSGADTCMGLLTFAPYFLIPREERVATRRLHSPFTPTYMNVHLRFYPNLYKDSVSLMTVSAKVAAVPGIDAASVVMASATNVENLARAGLGDFAIRPNDLVVVVSGTDEACAGALQKADELLSAKAGGGDEKGPGGQQPITSIQMAVAKDPAHNFALISVPGDYAASEAMKALRLGMDVMIFSDNVPVESELALKRFAQERNLMVMGPDCGTAIVNGVPLGFANMVRRGPIGVVGASGTGTQEVTVRIHQLGSGVSQALGTGGHDLAAVIGGISMRQGLKALDEDPDTKVIVLISKPPAPDVAASVLGTAEACSKPVVAIFLGADAASITRNGIHGADYLAQAADMAVALAKNQIPQRKAIALSNEAQRKIKEVSRAMAAGQRYVRGIFSGGTFCFEAQLIHAAAGITAFSNAPIADNRKLENVGKSVEHTIIDMGDDEFTQGRPHPMIDPSLRDARIREEAADPSTAVVLFDVVLGYGASANPTAGLIGSIDRAKVKAQAEGRRVAFIGYVCGTDQDPQNRKSIVTGLQSAGVFVASSNAEAAVWSASLISERKGGTK